MDEHAQLLARMLQQNMMLVRTMVEYKMQSDGDSRWLSLDLTMSQFKAVMIVVHTPGVQGVTMGQLAKQLHVGLPTASGIVDRLYEHGFVARQEDTEDRRVTRVIPTAKSREIVAQLHDTDQSFWHALFDDLGVDELRLMNSAFEILLKALRKTIPADMQLAMEEHELQQAEEPELG